MNRQSSLWVVLGGAAAAFGGWLLFSYLFTGAVNWLLALSFAAAFGLVLGGLSFMRARHARLQWQLTFSYIWVTVAALLVVELLLLGGLLAFVRSNFLVNEMGDALYRMFATEAQAYLRQEPPDLNGLNDWVQRTFQQQLTGEPDAEGGFAIARSVDSSPNRQNVDWNFNFDASQPLFVVDANGRLLAQNPPSPNFVAGAQTLPLDILPQLPERFAAIQQGERDLSELRYTLPDGRLVSLLPLVDDADQLLGVFIITLPLPALNAETLGPLLTMLLYSLLPLTLGAGLIGAIFGYLTARGLTSRISAVGQAAESWSQGDFTAVAQDPSPDELGQLSRRLNQMAEQLQNLLATRQELAALEERNRLARELHDSVKQQLFAVAMQVGAAQALLPTEPEAAAAQLGEANALARQAQQELSGLILELRPAALHDQGLVAALRRYGTDWSRQNDIAFTLTAPGERPLPLPIEQTLFRVAQEALANVARHSRARRVEAHLGFAETAVTLSIHDDGQGFEPSTARRGLGLASMSERVAEVNGRFALSSRPGGGATVSATVPYESETSGDDDD